MGGDTGGIFLFELKYSVMGFRNTGFNSFIHFFLYFLFILAKIRSGF